jgi:hypothetical protein
MHLSSSLARLQPCLLAVPAVVGALSLAGCRTTRTEAREVAAQQLGCPSDAVRLKHVEGHIYRAEGCGISVEVACYDPQGSTGAQKGWVDPLTAGNRSRCETLYQRPKLTNASSPTPAPSPAPASSSP